MNQQSICFIRCKATSRCKQNHRDVFWRKSVNVIIEYGLSAEIILSKNNSLMFLSVTSYWQDINILKISRRLAPALGELGRAVEGLNPSAGLISAPFVQGWVEESRYCVLRVLSWIKYGFVRFTNQCILYLFTFYTVPQLFNDWGCNNFKIGIMQVIWHGT